jgi:hypothetical protein
MLDYALCDYIFKVIPIVGSFRGIGEEILVPDGCLKGLACQFGGAILQIKPQRLPQLVEGNANAVKSHNTHQNH